MQAVKAKWRAGVTPAVVEALWPFLCWRSSGTSRTRLGITLEVSGPAGAAAFHCLILSHRVWFAHVHFSAFWSAVMFKFTDLITHFQGSSCCADCTYLVYYLTFTDIFVYMLPIQVSKKLYPSVPGLPVTLAQQTNQNRHASWGEMGFFFTLHFCLCGVYVSLCDGHIYISIF